MSAKETFEDSNFCSIPRVALVMPFPYFKSTASIVKPLNDLKDREWDGLSSAGLASKVVLRGDFY
ncbi:hypothetical protein EYZ11_008063 [Aspergillus tanneri]|uniref:Uncharacterized protein n=1 Tax=Aspergillus tanneri TaxID=1220188 RepID=A0A4S3JBR5_9EURO|nr:hypothetical protein EYZ11_008063 [Aspergillus tanneri]